MLGSNPSVCQKENLSQSEQYHHQSLCTRVKYLKLSEVKTRSACGTVVELEIKRCWAQTPVCAKKKISHNQNNTTTNLTCTRVKYLKLSEVKTRSCQSTVVECRTRDPEVLDLNPGVAKKKISYRCNHTIPPRSLCTRVKYLKMSEMKTRSRSGAVRSARLEIQRSQVQTLCGQKENLSQVQSEQYQNQSLCTRVKYLKLSEVKNHKSPWHSGRVQDWRSRDAGFKPQCVPKRKSLTIRTIPPPISLHQS